MIDIKCSQCREVVKGKPTASGAARIPRGWKRVGGDDFCQTCWSKLYLLRSITIPVVGPVGKTWPELRAALTEAWDLTTRLANWEVTELAKADVLRGPEDSSMPAMPFVYHYPLARERFPTLPSKAVATVLQSVQRLYRKARLKTIWHADERLPRYRFPFPYSLNNQSWTARFGAGGSPLIELRLPGGPFTLQLRGGPSFRRQTQALARIVSGAAVKGELAVYRQRANDGDNRGSVQDRKPGGGNRIHYRVMVKMTAWLPRAAEQAESSGAMEVRTAPTAFLTATADGALPWVLNVDHVRRWVASHRRFLDRFAEDTKYEKRWPKRSRRQMADYRSAAVERHHRRISTFCHQAAAMLAEYAARRGVAEVAYNDDDRTYLTEFPWFRFRQILAMKLEERGVQLLYSGPPGESEEPEQMEAA